MIKKLIKYFLYFILLAVIGIAYLSYFGIETKRFNQIITEKITEKHKNTNVKLKT